MAEQNEKITFKNMIDLGSEWLVKVFVPNSQQRTLVGRKITGIADHPKGGGRQIPTYDVEHDGWLDKWFAFIVPKAEGVYDLSARYHDQESDSVKIESTQVLVTLTDGVYAIRKMGYGEMIEHFGGARLTRKDGALVAVEATSVAMEAAPAAS